MSQVLTLHLVMMLACWWLAAEEVTDAFYPRPGTSRTASVVLALFFLAVSYQAAQQVFP